MRASISTILLALLLVACPSKDSVSTPRGSSAPAGTPASSSAAAAPAKDPARAKELIAGGALVLDVRTPEEFSAGHLDKAQNVPVDEIEKRISEVENLNGNDKTKPIVVYCAKGGRAAKAKAALESHGFTNVVNGGGYDDLR